MTGWIIYSIEDFEKNKRFVEMFREKFALKGVTLRTIILENTEIEKEILPDFAINRSRNYKIAENLETKGVRVFNSATVAKIANDKYETYKYLEGIIPFMTMSKASEDIDFPKIIKSCKGHGGSQVFLAKNQEEERKAVASLQGEDFLYQKCCSDRGKDVRVYIIGNKIVAAVLRTSTKSFKSNFSLGGKAELYELNHTEKDMVEKIIKKLPLDYAGIDFTFHHGKAVFNEIEDAVGARMLYSISPIDIVSEYVNYIVREMC